MLDNLKSRMEKSLHALKEELGTIRTGRANASLLDHVHVEYYGSDMAINQVAGISIPEPRMLVISPWEKNMLKEIEKAIQQSDLGLTPSNDGEVIRLTLPELTEERRRELVKQARQYGEQAKVAVRNIRRDANDGIKKQLKEKGISEDDSKRQQDQVQEITDRFISEIEQVVDHKEKDILTI